MSDLFSGKCNHDPKVLCGVVKNINNCPYSTSEQCQAKNAENWLGMNNVTFGTLTLKIFRYNLKKVKASVLEENMCKECRVIWTDSVTHCPICSKE